MEEKQATQDKIPWKKNQFFPKLDKVIFSLGFLDHIQLKRGVYRAVNYPPHLLFFFLYCHSPYNQKRIPTSSNHPDSKKKKMYMK